MKWLTLAFLPLAAFVLLYSLDTGCFVCLYGEGRGSSAEKWINGLLAAAALAMAGAFLWRRFRRTNTEQ